MREILPDFGNLVLCMALLFGALIVLFETLERRRESRNREQFLHKIADEYAEYRRLGWF